ncbi:MAG: hypothetical protein KKB90_09560 [Actinobacteria bacterium]|nr:hypothetical protein [Actinomycetota bacterium]MBU4219189.1 hypothetical protein [Actinomycetota bacterium]MBU4359032.1 hypothetical protein [Actinomycetota bacterium]MCG2820162.1 hypothetical protein [Actinomycetes bacterium]
MAAAIVLAAMMSVILPQSVAATGAVPAKGKVVLLIVDRVAVGEFPGEETPFCARLARDWSIGLMSTRTGESNGGYDTGAGYVSLGAGIRARGDADSRLCFNSWESFTGYAGNPTAADFYEEYSGEVAPESGVVCLGWQEVKRRNEEDDKDKNVGLLGKLLAESGLEVAVVGNTDTGGRVSRLAPLVCCDPAGAVPMGDVSDRTVVFEPGWTGGYRTRIDRLLEESARLLTGADMLVVQTGDTGRLYSEEGNTDEEFLEAERREALRGVDRVARELCEMLDLESSLLVILSPEPTSSGRKEGNYLTPCVVAGGVFGTGMLSSMSTRTPGIVSNSDFLPTVLEFYGIEVPVEVSGAAMSAEEAEGALEYLRKLDSQLVVTRKARWPVLIIYVAIGLLTLILAALCTPVLRSKVGWPRRPERLARFLAPMCVVLLAAPLSFIAVSAFSYGGYVFPMIFCCAFSVAVGLGAWLMARGRPTLDPVVSICLLTGGVIVVDLVMGGGLLMLPLFGVSTLEGMRFFGLTNTIAGLLIAVSIWAAAGLAGGKTPTSRAGRWTLMIALPVVSLVVGLGVLGANIGGFITAIVTVLLFLMVTSKRGLTGWRIALVGLITAAGTALVILVDTLFFRTHAGRAIIAGSGGFLPMIERKVSIQIDEINFFLVPSLILLFTVVAAALWIRRPRSLGTELWKNDRPRSAALFALLFGGIIAVVFNDTGIAMLAAMMVVTTLALAYYVTSAVRPFQLPAAIDPFEAAATPAG